MDSCREGLTRLWLLVQRLLDAEILPDADGERLMSAVVAARRCQQEGDSSQVRRHTERVARFTEALVRTHALDPKDGRAVLAAANSLLSRAVEDRPERSPPVSCLSCLSLEHRLAAVPEGAAEPD